MERRAAEHRAVLTLRVEPRLVLRVGLALAFTLAIVAWLSHVGRVEVDPDQLPGYLEIIDLDAESSLGTWLSTMGLAIAALAMLRLSERPERASWRLHWRAMSLIFLAMSIDEVASIHEATTVPLRRMTGASGLLYFAWVIPAAAVLLILALTYRRFLVALEPTLRRGLVVAGVLYVGGALGLELVGGAIADAAGERNVAYLTAATLEELLELCGITVLLSVLTAALRGPEAGTTAPAPTAALDADA